MPCLVLVTLEVSLKYICGWNRLSIESKACNLRSEDTVMGGNHTCSPNPNIIPKDNIANTIWNENELESYSEILEEDMW